MKLLAVLQLESSSGEFQADVPYNVLMDWDVSDGVQCMSLDTTSSNTSNKLGACVLLEQKPSEFGMLESHAGIDSC